MPADREGRVVVAINRNFDVVVVGGGIAGSVLAGVLARAGFGVLVVEKETRFRDRVRGEAVFPWGAAEVRRLGLRDLLARADAVEFWAKQRYDDRRPVATPAWETPGIAVSHPRLQEEAFVWAGEQGVTALRPARAVAFARENGIPRVSVVAGDRETEIRARLVVGADGKLAGTRRWADGRTEADREHHRMGGVAATGVVLDRTRVSYAWTPGVAVNWFAQGVETSRLYLVTSAARLRESGADRSFDGVKAFLAPFMPEGALVDAQQAGPIGYYPNNDVWASRIAGDGIVLVGDAAGAPDPSQGHGISLLFRDVRELSELLLSERDWHLATAEFAARRERTFAVLRGFDRWCALLWFEDGPESERRREGYARAAQADPTQGGFARLEPCGPDGLIADEATRRRYFGEDLA
jgi:2-polyprenyl-6-methoxyphenol hydroxylase-like FAD-dependent oxidoreductase